jgi:cell division protein FtsL
VVVAQERYEHYSLPEKENRNIRRPKRNFVPNKAKYSLTLLVLMLFGTGMLIAYYYTQVAISGYEIVKLNKQVATLQQETDSLAEEVNSLNTLGRVEYLATNKLKMVKPDSKDVVVVKANLAADNNQGNTTVPETGKLQAQAEQQAQGPSAAGSNKVVQAFVNLIGMKGS